MFKKLVYFGIITLLFSCPDKKDVLKSALFKEFKNGNFVKSREILRTGTEDLLTNSEICRFIGKTYYHEFAYDSAMIYYKQALSLKNATKGDSTWCYALMGNCLYAQDSLDNSKRFYLKSIDLNGNEKAVNCAKKNLIRSGLDNFYYNWLKIDDGPFCFHYQDAATYFKTKSKCDQLNSTYDFLLSVFKVAVPKKIHFFVWSEKIGAFNILQHDSWFANSRLAYTHVGSKTSFEHELTHIIFKFAVKPKVSRKIILEGIAVKYDAQDKDKLKLLKNAILSFDLKGTIEVIDIWNNFDDYPKRVSYYVGYFLIQELLNIGSEEELFKLFKNQSLESAKKIYGERLTVAISNIEKSIN